MTRLGRSLPGKQFDLAQAFRFLEVAPSYRELGLVVNWLRESGVEEITYDEELVELAEANGSGWHEALDLSTAVACGVESLYAGCDSQQRRFSSKAASAPQRRAIRRGQGNDIVSSGP